MNIFANVDKVGEVPPHATHVLTCFDVRGMVKWQTWVKGRGALQCELHSWPPGAARIDVMDRKTNQSTTYHQALTHDQIQRLGLVG